MNCYTVSGQEVQLGIALSREVNDTHLSLTLGKKIGQTGDPKKVILSPRDPASHVLVAGGIHLMRTAELHRTEGADPRFMFVKAKHGLKADTTDSRAIVLLDYHSVRTTAGYIPSTYQELPVCGFEVLEGFPLKYRVQALVVLQPNEHIVYRDEEVAMTYVVAYDLEDQHDRFPRLSCITLDRFRARDKQKFVAV